MNTEQSTEKHEYNRKTDEEEIETIKAELEIATEKVLYFENLIVAANSMRKIAEDKIIVTQSKKLDSLSNKLDSQIQSIGELIRKAETKKKKQCIKYWMQRSGLLWWKTEYYTQSSQIIKIIRLTHFSAK